MVNIFFLILENEKKKFTSFCKWGITKIAIVTVIENK